MERSFVFNVFSGEAAGIDGEGGGGQTGLGGFISWESTAEPQSYNRGQALWFSNNLQPSPARER